MTKTIKLPCFDIVVTLNEKFAGRTKSGITSKSGTITSSLHDSKGVKYNTAIDTLEAFILACACAGIDIESFAFLEAIETTVDGILNNV